MAIIGQFTRDDTGYVGAISTLTVQAERIRIVAEPNRMNNNSPTHRVYCGGAEIGVAWPKKDRAGNEYLNLKLDDVSFPGPIYPTLMQGDDGQNFVLVWSRQNSVRVAD